MSRRLACVLRSYVLSTDVLPHKLSWPSCLGLSSVPNGWLQQRYASTTPPIVDVAGTLKALHGAEFQSHLDQLRQSTSVMAYSKLLQEFRRTVPAATDEDATRVCTALADAGAILKQGTLVYLRPDEIAETLRRVLPVDVDGIKQQVAEAEIQLAELEKQHSAIKRRADMRSRALNYMFMSVLVVQWGLLFRLTYWELSWDVMEPVGFFVGGLTSLMSYAWFLRTRRDFTYEAMYNRFMSNYERKMLEEADFDIIEYNRLKNDIERLTSVLEAKTAGDKLLNPK